MSAYRDAPHERPAPTSPSEIRGSWRLAAQQTRASNAAGSPARACATTSPWTAIAISSGERACAAVFIHWIPAASVVPGVRLKTVPRTRWSGYANPSRSVKASILAGRWTRAVEFEADASLTNRGTVRTRVAVTSALASSQAPRRREMPGSEEVVIGGCRSIAETKPTRAGKTGVLTWAELSAQIDAAGGQGVRLIGKLGRPSDWRVRRTPVNTQRGQGPKRGEA